MKQLTNITIDQIINLLPKTIHLHYVDYRDSLDEHTELLQECINKGNLDPIYDESIDWFTEDGRGYYFDELKKDIARGFEIEYDEAEDLVEEHYDAILDEIFERDASNPVQDLLKNTSDQVACYDLDFYVEDGSWNWTETNVRRQRQKIKKHIGIRGRENDAAIDLMIRQASYGGQLVVFMQVDCGDIITDIMNNEPNGLEIDGFYLAIIDTGNGSGDHCFVNAKTTIPFDKGRLSLDRNISYSYTYAVCGMSSNWCDGTKYDLLKVEGMDAEPIESAIVNHIKKDKELDEAYRKGGCTAGDMKSTRHRNVTYINNYPCGNKCLDCGTFWID